MTDPWAGDADALRWTDDHCHLPEDPAAAAEQIAEAVAEGVTRFVTVGTDLASSQRALRHAAAFDNVWGTAGVHPHDAKRGMEGLDELLDDAGCVAVGECGLDFHYDNSPRGVQRDIFARQVALANSRDMPLVIHTREAWAETFEVLDAEGAPDRTVFHCFTGGIDEAAECRARGAFLSFSGIVTFPSADALRAAAAECPLDRMLVETDSPYLSPVPHRGVKNRPSRVRFVGAELAALGGHRIGDVAAATWANASAVYGLDREAEAASTGR